MVTLFQASAPARVDTSDPKDDNSTPQPPVKDENQSNEDLYTLKVARAVDAYIDAFTEACNSTHKATLSASVNQDSIRQALRAVNVDDVLNKQTAYRIFCETYGIRQWFVAPEDGVRGLLRGALLLYASPLKTALHCAHQATVEAATHAADVANLSEADSMKQLLLDQALSLLDDWEQTTWEQLNRNIHAEAEFPAPDRFARLKSTLTSLMAESAAKNAAKQLEKYKLMLTAGLATTAIKGEEVKSPLMTPSRSANEERVPKPEPVHQWSEFYMGWLEKCNRRGMWQRRWFALSLRQQKIWWFGHPEEQPARGVVSLVGATVICDIAGQYSGQPVFRILTARSRRNEMSQGDEISFVGTRTKKDVASLTLRASSQGGKQQWCDMISSGISGLVRKTPPRYELEAYPPDTVGRKGSISERTEEKGVPRKISTQVFSESTQSTTASQGDATLESHALEFCEEKGNDEKKEDDEGDRKLREQLLYEEIVNASSQSLPSPEEWEILECVVRAVREYLGEVQIRLTEQSAKLIADGMLPLGRIEDLHSALLKVLVPVHHQSFVIASDGDGVQ